MTSAPVTDWPLRLVLVGVVVAVIVAALLAMWRGWQRRAARQADVVAPPPLPPGSRVGAEDAVPGVYLATVKAGDWLDRVVVHGLGVRSRAALSAGPDGVYLAREGAPDLFIPVDRVRSARADRGIAGRVYERGGVLIVTWDLGGTLVDSGFRADRADDHAAVIDMIVGLADGNSPGRTDSDERTGR